jgi:sulfite reductase (NADPH) flavoprotein alpha-component
MAKGVHETLLKIIAEQGGVDSAGAEKYLATLVSTNRYVRDVN